MGAARSLQEPRAASWGNTIQCSSPRIIDRDGTAHPHPLAALPVEPVLLEDYLHLHLHLHLHPLTSSRHPHGWDIGQQQFLRSDVRTARSSRTVPTLQGHHHHRFSLSVGRCIVGSERTSVHEWTFTSSLPACSSLLHPSRPPQERHFNYGITLLQLISPKTLALWNPDAR